MILRCCEQERGHRDFRRERQLQRPEKAGHDQQTGQAQDEMENQSSPKLGSRLKRKGKP
jgi:hypothetical protein